MQAADPDTVKLPTDVEDGELDVEPSTQTTEIVSSTIHGAVALFMYIPFALNSVFFTFSLTNILEHWLNSPICSLCKCILKYVVHSEQKLRTFE